MLSNCPHCGRAVATEETLIRTRKGWLPALCCNGEAGALPDGSTEAVKNHPHWYTSAENEAGARVLLTGPYPTYDAAREALPHAKGLAMAADWHAPFYAFGIASSVEKRAPKIRTSINKTEG